MTPTPQETAVSEKTVPRVLGRPPVGEEIVISGMSGIFPSSDSVQEFMENLYNKVDMVTSKNPRWVFNHPEVPKNLGKVNGITKFDAQFFRVHNKQARTLEPMSMKLLEHTYSAIFDSGINPQQLRGKNVGVFIGADFPENENIFISDHIQRDGFSITGSNKAMYANRISYWMDAKGPSYTLDVACASSMACLEHAYRSIRSGQCEAAIVGGCKLCMHPKISLHYRRSGLLCLDGKTKCFDKNGDGHVRSDAISVLFLQKAKDAKRIYSEVYHAKANFSPGPEHLLPVREPKKLQEFLEAFYSEISVSPKDVEYIEANGSALPEADTNELKVIGKVFAKNKPIMVGCVKSNMGASDAASGVCGLTKVCLAYHKGQLPGNLHYDTPLDLSEDHKGKIQILTDNVNFGGGFAALNSFSYSGADIHVLLKGHNKQKETEKYKSSIPHLVLVSGRQESCVKNILNTLKMNPIDPEQIGLLHSIHEFDIPGHMSRGYSLLGTNENKETVCLSESVDYYPGNTRPVWFVYSGMGSQWPTMGAELMRIPIFAAAIQKCHKVLEPKGIDIVQILTDSDKSIYDKILYSFVGIAAVQIGLTDILNEMGVVPDNIIGHSLGELGCAYADGCFTAEEMILSAYSRGIVSMQTPFIVGAMAAIGLGYKAILQLCPPEIEVACHNSSESCTISGPAEIMKQFVTELTSQGIFAKEVPCSNIAYHSKYIAKAGPGHLKYLSKVIKDPKRRSEKWVSTSVPQDQWEEPLAKYSSAEYHNNNMLSPVLFEETSKLIPSDALVIEIAPHGLLQAILKRSLAECVHVPLTRRGTADSVKFFLDAVGKLYQAGLNPKIDILYPKIEYPVSNGTPLLSHCVEWEHSEDWPEYKFSNRRRIASMVRDHVMSIYDDEYAYFKGHVRDGNYVFPESAFLVLVWETLAMYKGVNYKDLSVIFKNVQFHGEVIIKPKLHNNIKMQIMILKGSDKFEITYNDYCIVSGTISEFKDFDRKARVPKQTETSLDNITLQAKDIYTIMSLRGYCYKDEFQSIHSSTSTRNKANIKWTDNWIKHLDSLLQFNAFAKEYDGVSVPSLINTLKIDVENHRNAQYYVTVDNDTCISADFYDVYGHTRCGGIEIDGLIFKDKPIVEQQPDILLTKMFAPNYIKENVELRTALQVTLQIVAENVVNKDVHVIDLLSKEAIEFLEAVKKVAAEIPSNEFVIKSFNVGKIHAPDNTDTMVVIDNLLTDNKKMNHIYKTTPKNIFILVLEEDTAIIRTKYKLFNIISEITILNQKLILLRKNDSIDDDNITYMPITYDKTFSWIPRLQTELQKTRKVMLVSERQPYCGLIGMVKKLRKDCYGDKVGLIMVDDFCAPSFNPEIDIFKNHLEKKLAINVLNKGKWGGYYDITGERNMLLDNFHLTSTVPGDLDSLSWIEKSAMPADNNLVQVSYAGVSNTDVNIATGSKDTGNVFGLDFSGFNNRGEKVMGVVSGGAIASTVQADPDLTWPVPEHWTMEDAATVPLAYAQAYYCLTKKCTLRGQSTVLVNGGAGPLGQAVISICLSVDCLVFVTVTDGKQKEFLLKMFPDLKESHIALTPHFVKIDGKLCDLIVNCLSGPMRKAASNCLGFSASFLDLTDFDMINNKDFEMACLFRASCYIAVNINAIFKPEYASDKKHLQLQIAEGIANGIVRPLSRVVYPPGDVTRAFRLLSSNKERSKVLIMMKSSETEDQILRVYPRISYSPKGVYIVICDESALSIELVDRLVRRGAKNLVLHMKPNSIAGYCYTKFQSWNKIGVSVNISSENLQTEEGCVNLFKEGAKFGPIRGIFIVQNFSSGVESWAPEDFAAKFNNTVSVVANLDLMSRNVCNELDHFVVLNLASQNPCDEYISSVTDKICRSRSDISLPALVFRAGLVTELDETGASQSIMQSQPLSAMFNALETGLKLRHNNVVTYNLKKDVASEFIQKISRIIGVKNVHELDDNLTLKDLLLNEISIEEINTAIKKAYQISYPTEKLNEISIGSLKNLGCEPPKTIGKDSGLGAFFTYIDRDECLAAEPIITMATLFSGIKEEEELDPKAKYLMLVPGFEGHHQIFTAVSERLKVQALTLQLAPDMPSETVPQIAANIAKFIRKRMEIKSKFYLLGYSFGINVAFELARLFEKEGHVGVVYCLDSSPDALRTQLDAYIGNLTDSQLQNTIIEHMYKLMTGRDSQELKQELETKHSWDDKVELCVIKLRGLVKYSHQYKRSLLHSAYRRIILAREYEPDFTLESELVLMKGIPTPNIRDLAEDYNLSKYTSKPVKVFDIESDHASAHQDCRVPSIINRFLEPKLLDEFNNKNLCCTYLEDLTKNW